MHLGACSAALEVRWVRRLEGEEGEVYDAFVASARGGHFAQSRAYLPVARATRLGRPAWVLVHRGGRLVGAAQLLRAAAGPLPLPVAWIERGPVCDDPADLPEVVRAVGAAARARGVFRLTVMPYVAGDDVPAAEAALARVGFRPNDAAGSHSLTLRLPLGPGELFEGSAYRSLRSTLKQAEKMGVTVRRADGTSVGLLAAMHDQMMAGQERRARPRRLWRALAERFDRIGAGLFVAEHEGAPIATALTLRHGRTATFFLGATSPEERRFSKMGPALAAAIRSARDEGAELFDLGGVPRPDDADAKRASIAAFKWHFAKTPVPLVREHVRWG